MFKNNLLTIKLLFIIFFSTSNASELNYNTKSTNITKKYKRFYNCFKNNCDEFKLTSDEIGLLKELKFILVPGMQYEILTAFVNKLPSNFQSWVGSMETQISFPVQKNILNNLGVAWESYNLSELSPKDFSKREILLNSITNSDKCLVLVGHSKGGVDILDALGHVYDQGDFAKLNKIVGFIPIQSPLQGTPHADLLNLSFDLPNPLRETTTTVSSIFNNIEILSRRLRIEWLNSHQEFLTQINKNIKIITVGSYIKREHFWWDTILTLLMKPVFALSKEMNDGLVASNGTILPGSKKIILNGIDHISTTMKMDGLPQTTYNQEAFTYAILKLLVKNLKSKVENCKTNAFDTSEL